MIHDLLNPIKSFADQHGEEILTAVTRAALTALVTETAKALDIPLTTQPTTAQRPPQTEEEILFSLLSDEPQNIDDLTRKSGMPVNKVSTLLLTLDMQGKIHQFSGQRFARAA